MIPKFDELEAELAVERQANAELRDRAEAIMQAATSVQQHCEALATERDEAIQEIRSLQRQLRSADSEIGQLKHTLSAMRSADYGQQIVRA